MPFRLLPRTELAILPAIVQTSILPFLNTPMLDPREPAATDSLIANSRVVLRSLESAAREGVFRQPARPC